MTICARCDEPILGEPQKVIADSATGAAEVYVHASDCRSVKHQTYISEGFRH